MPTLQPLTVEIAEALGKTQQFIERYEQLFKKSKNESIRDNSDAIRYIDDVIKRYKLIEATSPVLEEHKRKKNTCLFELKRHIEQIIPLLFSKPIDVITRLQAVGFQADEINKIADRIEQAAGSDDADALACCLVTVATSESSAICADNDHHHHHHHHHDYYHHDYHHHHHHDDHHHHHDYHHHSRRY